MKDKEIELKFRITSEQRQAILNYLSTNATYKGSERMIDTYYIPNFKDFEINGKTIECVRIREVDNSAVICYKHIHYEADPIYCDEFETKIDSGRICAAELIKMNTFIKIGSSERICLDGKWELAVWCIFRSCLLSPNRIYWHQECQHQHIKTRHYTIFKTTLPA